MEETKEWLKKAKRDLDSAKYNYKGKKYDVSAFLLQQCVEKSLKTVYIKKFKSLLKIHDIVMIGRKIDLPEDLLKECESLNSVYLESRYPDVPYSDYKKEEIEFYIKTAQKILKWTKKNI